MKNTLRPFFRQLLIITAVLSIVIAIMMCTMSSAFLTPALPYLLIFHVAATLISFLYIQKKTADSPKRFVNVYLMNTTIKLLLYLAILMIYSLSNIKDAVNFIISFFVLYLIFTIFEVIHLLKVNRQFNSVK